MIPKNNFFPYSRDDNDADNVSNFLTILPHNFELIFRPDTSNFKSRCLNPNAIDGISVGLFESAYKEVAEKYKIYFERDKGRITKERLDVVGFTEDSLRLKAVRLNELWDKIVIAANQTAHGLIDWGDSIFKKLLRKFLGFLNSLLGSLGIILPSLDILKEFKDFLETYLDEE